MAEEKIDPRKHRGFVGGEFTVTPQPEPVQPEPVQPEPVQDTEGTEDTAKPQEPTELILDVESRLAAIHNPDGQ